ncbi:stressosome-associated protein Prli42 [Pueribacillus theae]|nr:stressosome-associated protein Prli42 [Pueribacillus theae]
MSRKFIKLVVYIMIAALLLSSLLTGISFL